jgi:hypothetical protein
MREAREDNSACVDNRSRTGAKLRITHPFSHCSAKPIPTIATALFSPLVSFSIEKAAGTACLITSWGRVGQSCNAHTCSALQQPSLMQQEVSGLLHPCGWTPVMWCYKCLVMHNWQ